MTSAFSVELGPGVERLLRKLDKAVARRLTASMAALATKPHPAGCSALAGHPGVLRIKVGDYRIVYRVEHDRLVVLVLDIGHRGKIYRTW